MKGTDPEWKLIRDKLPEKFKREGIEATVAQIQDPEKMKQLLLAKLSEEIREFEENPSAEEMADILEVLESLQKTFGLNSEDIEAMKAEKREERGGFEQGFVLKLDRSAPETPQQD